MSANVSAVLYLVSAVLFILALRGLSSPVTSRQGNPDGHGRHGDRRRDDAVPITPSFGAYALIIGGLAIGGEHRRVHRPPHRQDGDAAAGRGLPLAGGPCRRDGGGLAALYAPTAFRHRRSGHIHARRWSR